MPKNENKCVVCGASGKTYTMFFCDENTSGPWCAEHFIAATGCTEESHGEGCSTAVYELDPSETEQGLIPIPDGYAEQ